jgi:hypothetical protein
LAETALNTADYFLHDREIPVVKTHASREFPYSLNRIEIGAVRRKEIEQEAGFVHGSPFSVYRCVVILCIVDHDYDSTTTLECARTEKLHEREKRARVELLAFPLKHELALAKTYRAEVSNAFSPGMV